MPKRALPGADELNVEAFQCVAMGARSMLVPVPTIQECGVTCVPINSTDHWLSKIVGNRCRGDAGLVVKEFVDGVLDAIKSAPALEAPSEPIAGGGQGESPGKTDMKGCAAIGLNSDSDEDELAARPGDTGKKARVPKGVPSFVRSSRRFQRHGDHGEEP